MQRASDTATPSGGSKPIEKPRWNQSAIWTGANLPGLLRMLFSNGWRVHPLCLPGCLIDLAFAAGNSSLRSVQRAVYGGRVARVRLDTSPIIILGHWRTGTTLLHDLLTLDPQHCAPTTFQCFLPNHFLLSERLLKRWTSFTLPENRPPDDMKMSWDRPQEDEFALCNLGVPSIYNTIAFPNRPPQHLDYLELEAISARQREQWMTALSRFLKCVKYRHTGRLVLKSPTHTFRLPTLLDMFPDARFIHLSRHPVAVIHSTVRLWKSLFLWHGYQRPRFEDLDEFVFDLFTRMHRRLEATRDLVPTQNLLDIRYEDLVADVPATLRLVYQQLGLGEYGQIEPHVDAYLADTSGYRPGRYAPSPQRRRQIFDRCRDYYRRYGYDAEFEG